MHDGYKDILRLFQISAFAIENCDTVIQFSEDTMTDFLCVFAYYSYLSPALSYEEEFVENNCVKKNHDYAIENIFEGHKKCLSNDHGEVQDIHRKGQRKTEVLF